MAIRIKLLKGKYSIFQTIIIKPNQYLKRHTSALWHKEMALYPGFIL